MRSAHSAALFRTCAVTGLKVHRPAEALIKVHAVVAIVAFLIGVIAATLMVLTRWQAVHLLSAEMYYRMVTAHGLNMLIFFMIFFEMAILYFAGPVLLNCRLPAPPLGWLAFALMVIGALMVEVMVFTGKADMMFTSYVPLRAAPPLGYLLCQCPVSGGIAPGGRHVSRCVGTWGVIGRICSPVVYCDCGPVGVLGHNDL